MTQFIKGLDLCESFFKDVAEPILKTKFPSLRYSAGVIGYGSDVIGFDDAMSTDHMWGPRFYLFLVEKEVDWWQNEIATAFSTRFPYQYKGFSTNFSSPDKHGVSQQIPINKGLVNPLVHYHTLKSYFETYLGYTPLAEISAPQWLTFTEHRLLGVTSGRVFHDDLGLNEIRGRLSYYPDDIWLWMMAAQWIMIAEEEAFVGRCGYTGDELGSKIVATRQIQRIMRLCFLLEKQYTPYSKWFGRAFSKLDVAPLLSPILAQVISATDWKARDTDLGRAYQIIAEKHNALGITSQVSSALSDYHGRPFQVLFAMRFAEAIRAIITSAEIKNLLPIIGSVSQFTNSTTVFDNVPLSKKLKPLYQ